MARRETDRVGHPFGVEYHGYCIPEVAVESVTDFGEQQERHPQDHRTPIGGAWGQIPLEKKFEAAERAIFRCQQKSDEANDSYLARADVLWQELLSKGTKLEELQAYIVLRGSLLSADDKKRVIIDSDTGGSGTLQVSKVQAAVRMLGAGFCHEMTSGKRINKFKTYDNSTALMIDDEDPEENFHASAEQYPDEDDVNNWQPKATRMLY